VLEKILHTVIVSVARASRRAATRGLSLLHFVVATHGLRNHR